MDDFIDERLRNDTYFENFLKSENATLNEENKEIFEAHAKWREADGGKFEYLLFYRRTTCSIDKEYSVILKNGEELSVEEEELMYMLLESNMKDMDERNGKEWNAALERRFVWFS